MKIGEVARRAGVTIPTLRYYERRGLIAARRRTAGNYREFGEDVLARIDFIKCAQAVGFDLENVRELLELRDADKPDRSRVRRIAERRLEAIKKELGELEQAQELLKGLLTRCSAVERQQRCPILEGLAGRRPPALARSKADSNQNGA